MTIAVVNFRTLANGSYSFIKAGQRRGFWRVLLVKDVDGPRTLSSRNVVAVPYEAPAGIDGVTERSAYCRDSYRVYAERLAAKMNAEALAAALVRHHTPAGL